MASDQLLYLELAKALARPSKAYRATKAGLEIPEQAVEGYKYGADFGDSLRRRKLATSSLSEALGGNMPPGLEGFGNTSVEAAGELAKPIDAIASLKKALREQQEKPQKYQQGSFLVDGKLTRFDPFSGQYESADTPGNRATPIPGMTPNGRPTPNAITGRPNISPIVAPTLPAPETGKLADVESLIKDIDVVRQSYDPAFVGPVDALGTRIKQRFGPGSRPEAATFGATVSGLRNKVLNLLSGAAISPAEAQRLMQQLPNENMSEVDFQSRLDNFDRELKLQLQSKKAGFAGAGYRNQGNPPPDQGNSDPLGLFK
jgi:hypothetical protein